MKRAKFGSATRTAGKMFFGLVLLVLAVGAGFGGTALVVYHQLGGARTPNVRTADRTRTERKEPVRSVAPTAESAAEPVSIRPVAATTNDVPRYTYANNTGEQASAPASRQKPVVNVPAPLETANTSTQMPAVAGPLNDPESQYIVDSRTGRVVGIDGTAGARREAEEEQRRLDAAPRAVAVQTPQPEVRVASAVMEAGQPIYHGAQPASVSAPGSQYVPVRRALPVSADSSSLSGAGGFRVAAYLADDRNRPALRAMPVQTESARPTRSSRVFRLPDGTLAVVPE